MTIFEIFKTLRKHRKLAEKRSVSFEQNKAAKYLIWFVAAFVIIYLIFFAVMFALIANDSVTTTSVEFLFGLFPFILTLDFLFRFTAQQTPAQIVKPYVLLPLPRYACIDSFIGSSLFSGGNLIWFAMIAPYLLMSVVFSYGLWLALGILLFFWLLILFNSQWYSLVRTLINNSIAWWLLPLFVYAIIFAPAYLGSHAGFDKVFKFHAAIGRDFTDGSILPWSVVLVMLVAIVLVNRRVQYRHIWKELSRTERTQLRHVSRFSFLGNYGETGQYIGLEIKTILRNKNPRKGFIFATAIVLGFSLIISLTNVYDSPYMTNFWCLYNYVIYGAMMLVRVMCNEGNYIDCLMVRKENILSLLRAKYIFYSAMLLFPFLLMLPTVFAGKWSLLMLISYAVFTAGFQYFILFQLAIYNKQTIPLNTKFISKGGMENNYFQLAAEMVNFFIPLVFVSVLQTFVSTTVSYIVMLVCGLIFIATHPLWLRNIYNRMMLRRYRNMEGFRASR